jgi:hypothetical protein
MALNYMLFCMLFICMISKLLICLVPSFSIMTKGEKRFSSIYCMYLTNLQELKISKSPNKSRILGSIIIGGSNVLEHQVWLLFQDHLLNRVVIIKKGENVKTWLLEYFDEDNDARTGSIIKEWIKTSIEQIHTKFQSYIAQSRSRNWSQRYWNLILVNVYI